MKFEYAGIPLEFTEYQPFERVAVYDKWGVDLLYLEWHVGLLAYYSPTGNPVGVAVETRTNPAPLVLPERAPGRLTRLRDYLFGRPDRKPAIDIRRDVASAPVATPPETKNGAAGSGRGFGPIVTDMQLVNRLMMPRQRLLITGDDWSGIDNLAFVSLPRKGVVGDEVCDPIGGPFPLKCDIVSQTDMGFIVYYQIRFATLPCEDQAHRLVLSHRYDVAELGSDNGYSARKVEGEIVFNGAMVHTHNITPDAFRSQFFLPIPLGHERKVESVVATGDGLTIEYTYTDTDKTVTFDPGDSGATALEISEKVGFYSPSMQNSQLIGFKPLQVFGGLSQ